MTFQDETKQWLLHTFGPEIAADRVERCDRFTEESLELVQSLGYSKERAHALVDYVFGRPVGDPPQEMGGTLVTLAALAQAVDLDMDKCAKTELVRCWIKSEAIREKQKNKPKGSALPQ